MKAAFSNDRNGLSGPGTNLIWREIQSVYRHMLGLSPGSPNSEMSSDPRGLSLLVFRPWAGITGCTREGQASRRGLLLVR